MTDKRYRVVFDREGCIGAGMCALANPEHWELSKEDGLSVLKGAVEIEKDLVYEKEIGEEELQKMLAAAQGCPMNVIHIIDLSTGERLI